MNNQVSNLSYIRAKNRVEKQKRFYTHLIVYIIVNSIITAFKVWGQLDSWASFTNAFLTINVLANWTVWAVFLILHFFSYKFGLKWEEQKINDLMTKELSRNK